MKNVGIIAEYNPFHAGHALHIKKTREAGAETVAVIMSGSMVQRGDIAIYSARSRAEAAIKGGADIVFELPAQYSLSPARDFSKACADIFSRLGCIDTLSFGAECPDIGLLSSAADRIEAAEMSIKEEMRSGLTYPQAVSKVLGSGVSDIISGQNNTLAIEYIRTIKGLPIAPFAVKRTVPHDSGSVFGCYASASHIRSMIKRGENPEKYLVQRLPEEKPCFMENAESAILFKLSSIPKKDFEEVPGCRETAGRLYQASRRAGSLKELCETVKTRNFTMSKIRRSVLLAALGITNRDMFQTPYVRVLALNRRGAQMLKGIRKTSKIPFGSSLSDLSKLSNEAARQAEICELASRLQSISSGEPKSPSEYRISSVFIETT